MKEVAADDCCEKKHWSQWMWKETRRRCCSKTCCSRGCHSSSVYWRGRSTLIFIAFYIILALAAVPRANGAVIFKNEAERQWQRETLQRKELRQITIILQDQGDEDDEDSEESGSGGNVTDSDGVGVGGDGDAEGPFAIVPVSPAEGNGDTQSAQSEATGTQEPEDSADNIDSADETVQEGQMGGAPDSPIVVPVNMDPSPSLSPVAEVNATSIATPLASPEITPTVPVLPSPSEADEAVMSDQNQGTDTNNASATSLPIFSPAADNVVETSTPEETPLQSGEFGAIGAATEPSPTEAGSTPESTTEAGASGDNVEGDGNGDRRWIGYLVGSLIVAGIIVVAAVVLFQSIQGGGGAAASAAPPPPPPESPPTIRTSIVQDSAAAQGREVLVSTRGGGAEGGNVVAGGDHGVGTIGTPENLAEAEAPFVAKPEVPAAPFVAAGAAVPLAAGVAAGAATRGKPDDEDAITPAEPGSSKESPTERLKGSLVQAEDEIQPQEPNIGSAKTPTMTRSDTTRTSVPQTINDVASPEDGRLNADRTEDIVGSTLRDALARSRDAMSENRGSTVASRVYDIKHAPID